MWEDFVAAASVWSDEAVIIRLALSLVIGFAIGTGRTMKRRGAGMKTHTLVCLGSTVVMLTGQYVYFNFPGNMDMTRLGAQVVSGVGFLGVGTILVTGRNQIRGLTTAAGLWACACFGLAVGVGFVEGAIYALIFALIAMKVLTQVENICLHYARYFDLYIEFENNKAVTQFMKEMKKENVKIDNFELSKSKDDVLNALVSVDVINRSKRQSFVCSVRDMEFVQHVEEL
ncbi:MgtC/SapB family protein [Chakrabartyella piscis]|uniref:MgtC/SapB family protein n=1 Tax=Chakrabartyella piscis TaxID=2918914 RepID=UPI002958DBC9|nr:MgtC/SapB family protein [Chakrabartyella piscis]